MDFDQAYVEHMGWRKRREALVSELADRQARVDWLTAEIAKVDAQLTTLETDTPALTVALGTKMAAERAAEQATLGAATIAPALLG